MTKWFCQMSLNRICDKIKKNQTSLRIFPNEFGMGCLDANYACSPSHWNSYWFSLKIKTSFWLDKKNTTLHLSTFFIVLFRENFFFLEPTNRSMSLVKSRPLIWTCKLYFPNPSLHGDCHIHMKIYEFL